MQKITLVAACSANRVIGVDNQIPWHLAEDFAFFKDYTSGKPVIMGRKTWDSLPKKPLPNRLNMVITRQAHFGALGAQVYGDVYAALAQCAGVPEVIIMGGEQIYCQTLPLATDLRLTEIAIHVQGDAYFPMFDRQDWQEVSRTHHVSEKNIAFDFVHYIRR